MKLRSIITASIALAATMSLSAQNPIIRDNFSADPSAHVFNGRVYVYPSHDIPAPEDYARKDWFCMADYHVYSSDNLVDWVDHGVIVDQKAVPWVNDTGYSMWAPDCNYKNGKYYFFFPAGQKPKEGQRFAGNGIGVAIADTPIGPFVPQAEPIQGIGGIDPCIFIDDNGTPYLAWSGRGLQVQQMSEDLMSVVGEPYNVSSILPKGQTEGPFLFKANGKYYYTFPWVEKERECLAYAMADKPLGPYTFMGKIMEQDGEEYSCWTNHHSVINFEGHWYLFYHHNDYSPKFDKNRSVCVDELFFNPDGSIQLVTPTRRGVGVTKAQDLIQIDRYTELQECRNVEIAYLNADRPFDGWKVIFSNSHQDKAPFWSKYDRVDFGKDKLTYVQARIHSLAGGKLEVRVDAPDGQLLGTIRVPGHDGWQDVKASLDEYPTGLHNLYILMTDGSRIDVNWVTFK